MLMISRPKPHSPLMRMRAAVQRVSSAKVTVGERVTGEIDRGLLVLLGVEQNDGPLMSIHRVQDS